MTIIPRPRKLIERFNVDEAVLSPRQVEIYKLVEKGSTVQEIAEKLSVNKSYISREISKIRELGEGGLLTSNIVKHPPSVIHALEVIATPEEIKSLTQREAEILALYIQGEDRLEVAKQLTISENTVDVHLGNAKRKLGKNAEKARALNKMPSGMIVPGSSEAQQMKFWMENPESKRIISLLARGERLSLSDQRIASTFGLKSTYTMEVERATGLNLVRLSGKKHYAILSVRPWVRPLIRDALKITNLKPIKAGYDSPLAPEEIKFKLTESQLGTINQCLTKYFKTNAEYQIVFMYSDGYSIEKIVDRLISDALHKDKGFKVLGEAKESHIIQLSKELRPYLRSEQVMTIIGMFNSRASKEAMARYLKESMILGISMLLDEIKSRLKEHWDGVEDARERVFAERRKNQSEFSGHSSLLL